MISDIYPSYLTLLDSGELQRRCDLLTEQLKECRLCPRECGADRFDGSERAFCGIGERSVVSSANPHFGEEPPITGQRGSGTIFFAGCNLRCWFCQNADISHGRLGRQIGSDQLAATMLFLQNMGCHNINLVSPTHVVPQILSALVVAAENGLQIPLVYNSGGYDSVETLGHLDGVVDIYMPDFKYSDSKKARRLSGAPDYPEVVRSALREMHRQVGELVLGPDGSAVRGLLVRHLVLPQEMAGTDESMEFLAREISADTWVNVMAQYRPSFKAAKRPEVNLPLRDEEYQRALEMARRQGLHRFVR
jgi:putative pyruvate formate lyase activating enzyme